MFHFYPVANSAEKKQLLADLDPNKDCLLVSDLRAKFEWQNHYLEKYDAMAEEFLFRPADLWKKLSHFAIPEYEILSNEYISCYLSSLICKREESFLKSPSAAKTLFSYMTQLSFVFEHPEGRELIKEWFKENVQAFHRWGHWFFIAEEFWFILKEEKRMAMSWVPALLLNEADSLAAGLDRNLYIDLGLEMKFVEAELFVRLAKEINVNLIFPAIKENPQFSMDFSSYAPFHTLAKEGDSFANYIETKDFKESTKQEALSAKRFSSNLSEVKDRVAEIRSLLDKGISPKEIAVLAGDIGSYWPVLRNYLQKEGVPCARPYNTSVQSLLSISQWLSSLNVSVRNWQKEDLEIQLFRQDKPVLNYGIFKSFYSKVYGDEDLRRARAVEESLGEFREFHSHTELKRDEFLFWALGQWPSKKVPASLEQSVKQFLVDAPVEHRLRVSDWLKYLAGILSKMEISIQAGDPEGIVCLDISSFDYVDSKYVFVLGLNEEALKKNSPLKAINTSDLLSLRAATGFPLSPEESRSFEYYLIWNQYNEDREFHFSYAATDFLGSLKAPNLLWMKAKENLGEASQNLDSPGLSRLDSLQLSDKTNLSSLWFSEEAVARDFGNYIATPAKLKNFSAGGFKDFLECPFKFSARYYLSLRSLPFVDLDMDRMKNGNIIHRIFELAIKEKLKLGDKDGQQALVERCLKEQTEKDQSLYFLERYQLQYQKILERFLEFECEWKKQYPAGEYYEQEYLLDVYWDRESRRFVKQEGAGPRFRAIVDRIDRKADQLSLVDYKNSGASYKSFSSWMKDQDFQLLFYTKVLRDILGDEGLDVFSAVYYSVRPMERNKGFVRKDGDADFLPIDTRHRNKIEVSELIEAEEALSDLLIEFEEKVVEGNLFPKPEKPEETCPGCDWKKICRAKHLNF